MFAMAELIAKFIHTADWHVGMENYSRIDPISGLSSRLADFCLSIDFIVDYAIKEKIDFLLFCGDVYKSREPTPTHQREFASRILRLSKSGIPCILLVGNHDTSNAFGKASSIDIYSTLQIENVHIIRKPQILKLKGVQVLGLPWLPRKDFENIDSILSELSKQVEKGFPLIVAAHASVEGAVFGSEHSVSLGGDFIVSKKRLASHPQTAYVALGHIHKRQVIPNNIPTVYSGSIERVDFGEEKEEKSFELVQMSKENNTFKTAHRPISTPARKFLTIKVEIKESDQDPTETVLTEISKHDFRDSVVKVVVDFLPNCDQDIKVQDVKKALRNAFIVAAVNKNIPKIARRGLGEGVTAEQLSPLELLEKYFHSKGFSESKFKTLKEYAKGLMNDD